MKKKRLLSLALAVTMLFGSVSLLPENTFSSQTEITASAEVEGDYEYSILNDGTVTITDYNGAGGEITIPSTLGEKKVTRINEYAFFQKTSITSIIIPNGVICIDDSAFRDCTGLISVTIPDSVTSIGSDAFAFCENLTSITIPSSVKNIGGYALLGTKWLENRQNKDSFVVINGILIDGTTCMGNVTIPSSINNIADYAFVGCTSITSVTIPDSVANIGGSAFWDCTSLSSVTITNSFANIGSGAFSGCTSLTSVTIPNGITNIGSGAFSGCTSLTSVTIPSSVKNIDNQMFENCTSLTSVTIPNGVTSIGDSAFSGCTSLTNVTIPSKVTSIGSSAFYGTKWLENQQNKNPFVVLNGILIDGTTCIGNVTIPSSVTSVGKYAFNRCTGLTSVTIPSSVTDISSGAFCRCSSLSNVTISNSVTSIGRCAFYDCTSLSSVSIPSSVTKIDEYAFGYITSFFINWIDGFTIYGAKGSAAEKYANSNARFKFVVDPNCGIEPEVQPTSTTVSFKYDSKDYAFEYSDNWLTNEPNAEVENGQIAMFSSNLAIAAYEKDNIKQCLEKMGFKSNNIKNIDTYEFMPTYEDNDRVAYTIAYKKVNGKDLFVVPIRGTHGNCEWISNFNLGSSDEPNHQGFYKAANIVKAALISEMKSRNVKSENAVLYFTGHSRGAAVANILAGEFSTTGMELNGYSVNVPTSQIFAYTYACPAVSRALTDKDKSLKNIYNYINPGDLIPALPLEQWGYTRYGNNHTITYSINDDVYYDFLHRFEKFTGKKYGKMLNVDTMIEIFTKIAGSQDEYNERLNKAVFEYIAASMTKEKYLPYTKDELYGKIFEKYKVTRIDIQELIVKAIGLLASETKPSAEAFFDYLDLLKEGVGITFENTEKLKQFGSEIKKAITNGHTGETYIKWTEAYYNTRTDPGHTFKDSETGAVIGSLGYKVQKCSICGKERVINYKPDSIENVVKNVEKDLNLTFHRCDEDDKTYGLFKSVEVDGKTVDPSNYSTKSGSLKLTLDKSFISKLSAGTHTVKVLFEDGFSETSIFVAENANEATVDRLAGKGRYETAAKISNKAYGFETASTVVLAYGLNYADALAGVSLAKAMNAPILLTNLKTLPNETLAEIKRLGASNVIILGGTGAVGEEVEKILEENNLNVERIAGKTRFETATKIAQKMQALNDNKASEDIFFVYAFNSADALSVSAVAAVKGAPVIYLKTSGELDDATANYLESIKGKVKNAYVIGGSGVISDEMMKKAGDAVGVKATRVFGANRFETCVAVNDTFKDVLNGDSICVATGMDFPDALAGGVFAALNKATLFLVNGKLKALTLSDAQKAYLKTKSPQKLYVFGGTGVVPDSHVQTVAKASV